MSEECPHEGGPSQSTLSPSQDMASCSQSKPQSQPGSGSSSGPTTSSQSSSGSGTLSSVDTIPVTLPSVPEEPETEPWGRLLPMARGFRSHGESPGSGSAGPCCCWSTSLQRFSVALLCPDCVEDQYLFGRDSKCNYVLDDPENKGSRRFQIYSKKHFRIYRVSSLHL